MSLKIEYYANFIKVTADLPQMDWGFDIKIQFCS